MHISKYTVEDTTAVSGNEIRGQWVLCKAVRWYGYGCKEYRGGADEVRGCSQMTYHGFLGFQTAPSGYVTYVTLF